MLRPGGPVLQVATVVLDDWSEMRKLVPVDDDEAIFAVYRGSPIEQLLRYHNLGAPLPESTGYAHLLVSMCMDHRKDLALPKEFAYVLRSAGGNLRGRDFEISYAIAVGGVETIALLAHTRCGMSDVTQQKAAFVRGMTERAGWTESRAAKQFDENAATYQIGDPVVFVCEQTRRLRERYPAMLVAALLYDVDTDRLAQIDETRDA